jgi:hypothetical protein
MLLAKQTNRSGKEVLRAIWPYVGAIYELQMSGILPDRLEQLLQQLRDTDRAADRRTDRGTAAQAKQTRHKTLPRAA